MGSATEGTGTTGGGRVQGVMRRGASALSAIRPRILHTGRSSTLRQRSGITPAFPWRPPGRFDVLVTARECYPALERLTMEARETIWLAFRVFDPTTRLREVEVPGGTWADLLRHRLRDGVEVRLLLADFDPVGAPALHEATWHSVAALAELGAEGSLEVLPVRHDARVGPGLRYGFWPLALGALEKQRRELNQCAEDERCGRFLARPGLWRYFRLRTRSRRLAWRLALLPRLFPATHHQKIAVFDGRRAVIGGLDVDERRYDDPSHDRPARRTWHDVSVMVDGPVAFDIARHVAELWNGDRLRMASLRRQQSRDAPHGARPLPAPARPLALPETGAAPPGTGEGSIRLVRTISDNERKGMVRLSPRTVVKELEDCHVAEIARAERLIYIETQFLRSRVIAEALAKAGRRRPDLGLILVLPAAPEDIAFEGADGFAARYGEHLQSECIDLIREGFDGRETILCPVRPVRSASDGRDSREGAEIVYVHSKILIRDDAGAVVSSANLNGRSLRWDIEAGVHLTEPGRVSTLRQRLFRHWMPEDAEADHFVLETAVQAWRRLAKENATADPDARRGFLVPYSEDAAERYGISLPGVPPEMV